MSLIDSISGKLFAKNPTEAIVDIGGIRFRIHISVSAYDSLPGQGEPVELLTHLHVKEDILDLYGFKDHAERSLFMNLNTISGIGPRSAMNILSGTNPDEFKSRIIAGDVKSLTVIPGIGAKTAKRIIVELKEKFDAALDGKDELGFTLKYREDPILLDPRNKKLGARLIINLEKIYLSLKKLELKSKNQDEYYDLSFDLGIAQKNTEKLKNKLFGIECNFEELNAIDFKKGCYVGQENTSRIKLKNKLAKRLLPIKIVEGTINEGDSIINEDSEIGKVLISKNYPFAVIKYTSDKFNFNSTFKINDAKIKIIKPNWL